MGNRRIRRDILLVADPIRAERNREMVAKGEATDWWQWLEHVLATTPHNQPLPPEVPIGELPGVGDHENLPN